MLQGGDLPPGSFALPAPSVSRKELSMLHSLSFGCEMLWTCITLHHLASSCIQNNSVTQYRTWFQAVSGAGWIFSGDTDQKSRKLSDESQGARASIKAARVAEASAFFPHVGTRKGKDLYTKYVYIPLKEYDNMWAHTFKLLFRSIFESLGTIEKLARVSLYEF